MKSFLQRVFSIISLFFCTVSVASAWEFGVANNLIKFETEKENADIREGKKVPIKVRLKFIDKDIINEILQDFDLKSLDANNLIPIGDDFVTDIYENRKPNITFYEYFRINNVNYQLKLCDNGDCERDLKDKGIDVYLNDNNNDFIYNKQMNCYTDYELNNFE